MGTPPPSPKGGTELSPIFGQFLLWPNGWVHQDATWYGGRPQPRQLCVRWGPSYPQKKVTLTPTRFLAHVSCGQTAGWMKTPLGRPRPRPLCIRRVPSYPRKGHSSPPLFGPCLLWPRSPISATAELLYWQDIVCRRHSVTVAVYTKAILRSMAQHLSF